MISGRILGRSACPIDRHYRMIYIVGIMQCQALYGESMIVAQRVASAAAYIGNARRVFPAVCIYRHVFLIRFTYPRGDEKLFTM